ncbi:major facilitator superfamily-domain-containing protein [Coniochaeta sp. 2T2.1]|nr:major facilitator superfamily-domain-containing protein [Coniochaeta sp. 2T2.1]
MADFLEKETKPVMLEPPIETSAGEGSVLSDSDNDVQAEKIESKIAKTLSARSQRNQADASAPYPEQRDDVRHVVGLRWIGVCVVLYIVAFLYGLDTTIAADVQGPVVERFGHVEQLAWIGAGFPLGSVAVILLWGKLYISFNMKWLFIASFALFEAGSALCGGAPNMSALIVGRVIAGSGGAGIYLGALNIVTALTTMKERGQYIALVGFFWGLGAVLGPVIGGAFSTSGATWRWAFYINLVIGGVMSPLVIFALPSIHPSQGVSIKARILRLDFLGFLFNAGIWVSFAMATTMGGQVWPWGDGRTIATFVVFGVLIALYAVQQYFCILTTEAHRSFPVQLLKHRSQVVLYFATSANVTAMFIIVYFIPIFFQFVHGDSAIEAAVRLLPFVLISVTFNLIVGAFLPKIQYYMIVYVISGVFVTLGGGLLFGFLDPDTSSANIYGFSVLAAIGCGMTLQSSYAVASIKVPQDQEGDAISLQNVAQIGGGVISLVIAGQVFQSKAVQNLHHVLAGQGFTDADIQAAVAGAQSVVFEKVTGELRAAAIKAITEAMKKSFILVVVAGAVLLVSGVCLKFERLFKEGEARAVSAA